MKLIITNLMIYNQQSFKIFANSKVQQYKMEKKQVEKEENIDDNQGLVIEIEDQQQSDDEPQTIFPNQNKPIKQIKIQIVKYKHQVTYLNESKIYTINISNQNQQTKQQHEQIRTDFDFQWLDKKIKTKYPGIATPVYFFNSDNKSTIEFQRKISAQQYLKYILCHEKLRYCPQINSFLGQKIPLLEAKMSKSHLQIQKTLDVKFGIQQKLNTIIKTNEINNQENKTLKDCKQHFEDVKQYVSVLKNIIQFNKKKEQSQLKQIKNEKNIFNNKQIHSDLTEITDKIEHKFLKYQQKYLVNIQKNYIKRNFYLRLVYQNLLKYCQTFNSMNKLTQTIDKLTYLNKPSRIQTKYLKLMQNNLLNDVNSWLEYNNNIINNFLN